MKRAISSYNDRGASSFLDFLGANDALAPDFVMVVQDDLPNGGEWRGPEGFREMVDNWMEAWDEFDIAPGEPVEVSEDRFLVPVRQHVVAKGSGMELASEFFYTVELVDGRFSRIGLYTDRNLAEAALRDPG